MGGGGGGVPSHPATSPSYWGLGDVPYVAGLELQEEEEAPGDAGARLGSTPFPQRTHKCPQQPQQHKVRSMSSYQAGYEPGPELCCGQEALLQPCTTAPGQPPAAAGVLLQAASRAAWTWRSRRHSSGLEQMLLAVQGSAAALGKGRGCLPRGSLVLTPSLSKGSLREGPTPLTPSLSKGSLREGPNAGAMLYISASQSAGSGRLAAGGVAGATEVAVADGWATSAASAAALRGGEQQRPGEGAVAAEASEERPRLFGLPDWATMVAGAEGQGRGGAAQGGGGGSCSCRGWRAAKDGGEVSVGGRGGAEWGEPLRYPAIVFPGIPHVVDCSPDA